MKAKKKLIHYRAQIARAKALRLRGEPKLYFAYGSNLNIRQMRLRCPTAKPLAHATLEGWKLTFRGVADIVKGDVDDIVYGAVFHIEHKDEHALDVYEGYPHLYEKAFVKVRTPHGVMRAMVYYMNVSHDRASDFRRPGQSYLNSIYEGYKDFKLPRIMLSDAARRSKKHELEQAKFDSYARYKEQTSPEQQVDDFIQYVADAEDTALINWAKSFNTY